MSQFQFLVIQSKLRNRLLPENARKIVMSHMWLRLEQMRQVGGRHVGATGPGLALGRGAGGVGFAARGVGYFMSQIKLMVTVPNFDTM